MAGKNLPENDPHESEFFEDLAERVFKDYEPPQPEDSSQEDEDVQADEDRSAA